MTAAFLEWVEETIWRAVNADVKVGDVIQTPGADFEVLEIRPMVGSLPMARFVARVEIVTIYCTDILGRRL